MRVFVESTGLPSRVEIQNSSGFKNLDDAAMVAVQRWKFIPARYGKKVISAWVVVPILFNLKGLN